MHTHLVLEAVCGMPAPRHGERSARLLPRLLVPRRVLLQPSHHGQHVRRPALGQLRDSTVICLEVGETYIHTHTHAICIQTCTYVMHLESVYIKQMMTMLVLFVFSQLVRM
jgi:hypothetical protein